MNILLAVVCLTTMGSADTSHKMTLYDTLALELRVIDYTDQRYRLQIDDTARKYGSNSRQMTGLYKRMAATDSANLIKIDSLINKYGWLGPDLVGSDGTATLFAVIQHADLKTQKRYLPMLRDAAKTGKLKPAHLALLEDRVALKEGREQIYGSQLTYPGYAVLPLENPDSVDIRRAAVGLEPLSVYLKDCCNMDTVIIQKKPVRP